MHDGGDNPADGQDNGGGEDGGGEITLFEDLAAEVEGKAFGGQDAGCEEHNQAERGEDEGIERGKSGHRDMVLAILLE